MGILTSTDRHGQSHYSIPKIGGVSLTGLFTATALFGSLYVNEAREVSLEVRFGEVVDVITDSGINTKVPFFTSRYAYSLARQTTRVGEATTLRTSDDVRLMNPFTIEYKIDENADLKNLYYQLKGTGDDIEDVVKKLSSDVAVRVFEGLQVTNLAEEGVTDQITSDIQKRLQADLTAKGWPVTIIDVLSDGFQLRPESEQVLARIIDIRQESARLDLRMQNAIKAEEVLKREAQAYVGYAQVLKDAGLPESDLRCAVHDKMAQEAGRVMGPFAQVCGTGTGTMGPGIAVAVDPSTAGKKPLEAAPSP